MNKRLSVFANPFVDVSLYLQLGSFLEKEKLKTDGSNFTTWFRTLRILLVPQKMIYVLEAPLGVEPAATASQDDKNVYQSRADDFSIVQSGMLYAMKGDLQIGRASCRRVSSPV